MISITWADAILICFVMGLHLRFVIILQSMDWKGFVFLLLGVVGLISCCRGVPNPYPTIDSDFQKVQMHQFGEKYAYHNEQLNQSYYLVKVWGSSYQAGVAYGTLMRKQINALISELWGYYKSLAEEEFKFITKVPEKYQPLARSLAMKMLKSLLLANHFVTKPFTSSRYAEEYAGISAGSGIKMSTLIEVNMLPEFTRAGCSILGVWGKATKNGDLIHLRALDWDARNPINKYPTLVMYNLNQKGSKPFVNVGWAGFVGSLTGFGVSTGIGEKVRKQKPVKENETRIGTPWTYALRDVLQFADTIDDALNRLNKTRRTCSIHVGISSVKNQTFRLIQYSHKEFNVYDDHNFPYKPTHLQMDGVVSMPIYDDKNDPCFNDLLKQRYGNIDEDWIVNMLAASHKTGDTQMAAYNFKTQVLLLQVSNSNKMAFQRPTIRIPLAHHFASLKSA